MSELTTNLNNILDIKGNIKSAIENKGVDMTGVSFPGYASKIGEITTSFVTVPLNVSSNGTYNPGQGIDGYSQVVVDVPISGWDQKSFTEGTIEIINLDNSASFVASSIFKNNTTIQTVNLPYATSVGMEAFYRCSSLTQMSLPVCKSIGTSAFYECYSLSQVNLPMCEYIGDRVFNDCSSLSQVNLPMCSYIGNGVFEFCSSLSQVNLPICKTVNTNAFNGCILLTSIDLPMCEYINQQTFNDCSSLSQVNLPMCEYIGHYAFRNCYPLSHISLPVCSNIMNYAFWFCSSFNIITLGYSSVCSLNNSNAFSRTQITSSTGSIYVPASLVDAYKSASNWSYFSTQIFPIPE